MSFQKPEKITFFYSFCCFIVRVFFKSIWGLKFYELDNIPSVGPVILAPNHRSYADPPLVGCPAKRAVHFLAKKELFNFPPFAILISSLLAHPLNRKAGSGGLKLMKKFLSEDKCILVFPEGKRIKSDHFGKPKGGIGLLAVQTGAPVVPVYVHDSSKLLTFKKLEVYFDKPFYAQKGEDPQAFAERIMEKLQILKARIEDRSH